MACLTPCVGLAGLVGEPAPPLEISKWIKGQPVKIPGTNILVLEIWETTHPACVAVITNLSVLQERYRSNGVVIVGVSDEPVSKIENFVAMKGRSIDYEIAADNKRRTSLTYMNPVMERNIPYVFVVGTNGDLLWHGFPTRVLDGVLHLVTTGAFDENRAHRNDLAAHQFAQYLHLARQGTDRAKQAGQNLLAARTNDVDLLCQMAEIICTTPNLPNPDFSLAGQALDQAEKLVPTNSVEVMLARSIWLFESGKHDQGLARANQALALAQSPLEKTNAQWCIRVMNEGGAQAYYRRHHAKSGSLAPPAQDSGGIPAQNSANQPGPDAGPAGKL